jgi:hypothetical protein
VSTVVIDLNDAAVSAWRDGAFVLRSPGYALLGTAIEAVGEQAWAQARLQPRAINDRFWDELGLEPLPPAPGGALRTPADLACEHLSQMWSSIGSPAPVKEVFLAVPGFYSRDQLALVLGMARECSMPVAGMIDTALAAVSRAQPGPTILHLDLQLHRAVVTRFTQGERLARAGVETRRGAGLSALRERWLVAAAQQFIATTRFDPLHDAGCEQQLYSLIDEHLEAVDTGQRLRLEVKSASATHATSLDVATLERAADDEYARIIELARSATTPGESVQLHLAHRVAALPGLARRLAELPDVELVALPGDAVEKGVMANADALRGGSGDGVTYLTNAPWLEGGGPALVPPQTLPTPAQVPTHVLYEGLARSLGPTPLTIGSQVAGERDIALAAPLSGVSRRHCAIAIREDGQAVLTDSSSHGTFVNGRRVDGEVLLRLGDRLRVGTPGHEIQLVRVVN